MVVLDSYDEKCDNNHRNLENSIKSRVACFHLVSTTFVCFGTPKQKAKLKFDEPDI